MSITEEEIQAIQSKIHPILGKPIWGVYRSWGSFISIEFGEQINLLGDIPKGEWSLDIRFCAWRLQTSDEVIVSSNDSHEEMDPALQRLDGVKIISMDIQSPSMFTTISFEGGLILRLFTIYSQDDNEIWKLFTPDHHVLIIGRGGKWNYIRSDVPRSNWAE